MTVRFLHSADWQLGMTRHFLVPEAQARFSQARIDAIRSIGAVARRTGAAFVVVGGDVFETNQVDPRTVLRALEAIAEVPVPVLLLPGNHDPLDASSVYRSETFRERRPPNLVLLDDATPRPIVPGVEVVGAPWRSKRPLEDLVAAACAALEPAAGVARVLVGHGAVDTFIDIGDNVAAISVAAAEAALRDGRIAYLALGDRHSTTEVGASGRIWYAGAPEPTDYDEQDPGNILLVELADGRCTVTRERVGTWRFALHHAELDGAAGLAELEAWLRERPDKDRTIAKLALRGTIPLGASARLDALLEEQAHVFAAIEQWERHTELVVRPDDDDFADLAVGGFAHASLERLRAAAAGGGPDGEAATDALALLVRFLHGGGARS